MNEYSALRLLHKKLVHHKEEIVQSKKFFIGALILDRKGNVVSIGNNNYIKSHPYQKRLSQKIKIKDKENQIYLHAEISALVKCNTIPHIMIIARIGVDNNIFRLAKPCPLCQEAIKQSGIKKVYYTNDKGELVLFDMNSIISQR